MAQTQHTPKPNSWKGFHRLFSLGALRPHTQSILPYLDRPNGSFVEIGARDGGKNSLTPYLEKSLKWEGLLVEPWPHLFQKCRKKRKSATVNVAATERSLEDSYLEIIGRPPSASVRRELSKLANQNPDAPIQPPAQRGKQVYYINTDSIDRILKRSSFASDFELLALNLLGYENAALEGIDFSVYKPTFILVRVSAFTKVLPNLPLAYERVCTSPHDQRTSLVLFRYADFGPN
ncbi:MAG: FkbM family methyltransferase [Verrucomicrobiota bacterium]